MNFKEIISTIALIIVSISTMIMIMTCIWDIVKSNRFYKEEKAYLDLMRTTFQKENDLLKKTQEFNEWLDTFLALMYTNVKLEDTEFNQGVLKAAADIEGKFLEIVGEYVDGKESSD